MTQAGLELTIQTKLASNSQGSAYFCPCVLRLMARHLLCFESATHYVAQSGFELMNLPSQPQG